MRRIATACVGSVLLLASAPAVSEEHPPTVETLCPSYTGAQHRALARRAWLHPGGPTSAQARRHAQMLRCARTSEQRKAWRHGWQQARQLLRWPQRWRSEPAAERAWANSTSWCESRHQRVTPGPYHSYFQWSLSTWHSAGGSGDPEDHGYPEQAVRAIAWKHVAGASQWPVCGV